MFAARHEHNHVLFHLVLISGISLCSGAFISCCSIFSFQLAALLITMFNKVYSSTSSFADAILLKGFVDYELEGVSSTAYWNRFVFLNCCQIAATILDLWSSFFNFARHPPISFCPCLDVRRNTPFLWKDGGKVRGLMALSTKRLRKWNTKIASYQLNVHKGEMRCKLRWFKNSVMAAAVSFEYILTDYLHTFCSSMQLRLIRNSTE